MKKRTLWVVVIICLLVVLSGLVALLMALAWGNFWSAEITDPTTEPTTSATAPPTDPTTRPTDPTTKPTDPTTKPTEPTDPPIVKVSTATIANMGDFLMHLPVINTADIQDGIYDFANVFPFLRDYITAADYAVANLETTLAGTAYPYKGYPQFNCPDGIVSSLQAAGFDMLLTANNHTYDTYNTGFNRTQEIITGFGMDYLGTVLGDDIPLWQIHEINGIRIGMVCYTYETDPDPDKVALNGIPMSTTNGGRIGAFYPFNEAGREVFYTEMAENIQEMTAAGAEAIVLYIHWGDEYQTTHNSTQSAIAQKMCDLGVDVIVGSHPHVIQPMELLSSTTDETHKTVCLYSTGNALSNQRIEAMESQKSGHTEDGIVFSFTFAKYSDGTVILEQVDLLPTWVDLHYDAETGKNVYSILPLDTQIEDWQTQFGLNDSRLTKAQASYNRTMAIVETGLAQVQSYLAQFVADTEAALGITS